MTCPHGPEFVSIVMALYEGFGGANREEMEESAKNMNISYGLPSEEIEEIISRALDNKSLTIIP